MKLISTLVALAFLLVISCTTKKTLSINAYYDNYSKKNAHKYLGEYANLYKSTNGIFGLKYYSHGKELRGGASMIDLRLSPEDPTGEISINDERFSRAKMGFDSLNKSYIFCSEDCFFANAICYCDEDRTKHLYGKTVAINYFCEGIKRIEKSMYVPLLLAVNLPTNQSENEYYVKLEKSNLAIQWNEDEENEYGVIISIASTYGSDNEYRMKKTIKVADNGYFKFDPKVLKEIPSGSRVLIDVSRGRYPIVEDVDGYQYTLRFCSEYSINATLI